MAKVTAPILSGRARGQIGTTQVYASWRGVQYARSYVVPRNPQTAAQTTRRDIFAAISDYWKRASTIARAPWTAAIIGRPLTARNLIIKANLQPMVGELDRQAWTGSPGSGGGVPPTLVTATGGATPGQLAVTITSPLAPTGWTLQAVQAIAFADGLPTDFIPSPLAEGENITPTPGSGDVVTLTGLPSVLFVAAGWTLWAKPNGSIAYGASLTTTATPTA